MSVAKVSSQSRLTHLEASVRDLPSLELARFADWFGDYLVTRSDVEPDSGGLSKTQAAELERRMLEAKAHPELLEPVDAAWFAGLRKEFNARVANKSRRKA